MPKLIINRCLVCRNLNTYIGLEPKYNKYYCRLQKKRIANVNTVDKGCPLPTYILQLAGCSLLYFTTKGDNKYGKL